ncbi:MAG: SAP domain-containing protein [Desulfobulbaceae bacterium BRH_c16a]|nr:MAG: SAP domain-containing protein [Desulfobulbaceae bacterium BRH_c16a]
MKMIDVQKKAKKLGMKTHKIHKADLIRKIQAEEGNFPCFQMESKSSCGQEDCCWRKDCLS